MKNLRRLLIMWLILGGARAAFATTGTGAVACKPAYGETPGGYFSVFGMTHDTSSDEVFWCPVIVGTTSSNNVSVSSGWFNFEDGSSTDQFWCWPALTYAGGAQWYGRVKYTCSTGGGCNDPTTAYTGINWLGWGGADLPQGGTFTLYDNNYFGYYCQVPAVGSAGNSWVFAYGVN